MLEQQFRYQITRCVLILDCYGTIGNHELVVMTWIHSWVFEDIVDMTELVRL